MSLIKVEKESSGNLILSTELASRLTSARSLSIVHLDLLG